MSTYTLSCLVVGENPYENAFNVKVNKTEAVSELRKAIKEEIDDNVKAKDLKLWKVDISLEKENKKLELVNTKINVNIKEGLGGEELPPLSKISKYFTSQPADEHIHIIVQRPVEDKEVRCTASYGRVKKKSFQWTVTREMVTLAGLKKKISEYFTFPEGTETEHLIISRVIGGMKRRISGAKKPGTSSSSKQPDQGKLDEAEIESKTISISADEDLVKIVWTSAPIVDLEIVVDTSQQQFSSYTYSRMKILFNLQVDDYNQLPVEVLWRNGNISSELVESVVTEILRKHTASPPVTGEVNEATRREFISSIIYAVVSSFDGEVKIYPEHEVSGSYGKGPIDYIIKIGDIIICVTEAKKNDISHGIGQSTVQAHATMQCNRKKRSYELANLYDEEMFCIISTGIDWAMTKVILKGDSDDIVIRLCEPRPDPIPINKVLLTRDDLYEPVRKLLIQIKGLLEEQKDSLDNGKRHRTF